MKNYAITCPKCQHQFNVEEALGNKLKADFDRRVKQKEEELSNVFQEKEHKLIRFQAQLKDKESKIALEVQKALKQKEADLKTQLSKQIMEEKEVEFRELQNDLQEKKKQLKEAKAKELEIERLKEDLQEQKEQTELEVQKRLNEERSRINKEIQERLQDTYELKLKDKDHDIESYKKQVDELKRKMEQGSMQKQGEVQELAIERFLCGEYPFDEIKEVSKGKKGADVLQYVKNERQQDVGLILYESKRTKHFSQDWLQKIKADQMASGADIAVIVTETMPEEGCKMTLENDIWICDFPTFKWLSFVLRQKLMELGDVMISQKNKGDKMNQLYNYLTGTEFKNQIITIIDSFEHLINLESKERGAMERIWKERRKHLELVYTNTNNFYGSIKGLAGNALPDIDILELPE